MRWRPTKRRAASAALAGGVKAILPKAKAVWHIGVGDGDDLKAMREIYPDAAQIGVDPLLVDGAPLLLNRLFRCAAHSESRQGLLHLAGVSSSLHPVAKAHGCEVCRCEPLDKLLSAVPSTLYPDVVCMDCEGGELHAIAGGQEFFRRAQIVTVELVYHRTGGAPEWPTPTQLCDALKPLGLYLMLEVGRIWPRPGTDGIFVRA